MRLQRRAIARERLSEGDRNYLRYGSPLGAPTRFEFRDRDGAWQRDEAAALDAWLLHRAELLAVAAEDGLIPWAARHFEGMAGAVSPYELLQARP